MPRTVALVAMVFALIAAGPVWLVCSRPLAAASSVAAIQLRAEGIGAEVVPGPLGAIFLYEGGEGPPMVLVHGFGDRALGWRDVMVPLSQHYRVIAPDLPGHGHSTGVDRRLTLADTLEGLRRVVDGRAGDEPIVLVGNSMGGWLSILFALERPERVARLVLVNSGGLRAPLDREVLLPDTREGMRRKLSMQLGDAAPNLPGFVLDDLLRSHRAPALQGIFDSLQDEDYVDDRLVELAVPTELLWGGGDPFLPESVGERMEAAIPAARLQVLPGCAHAPQFTCAAQFAEVLIETLESPAPTPGG